MNVDWAIALSVFLIFIGIGMASYWGLFQIDSNPVQNSLDPINQKVLDYLIVDSWTIPVNYSSPSSGITVMYFDFQWPEGTRNSTQVFYSNLPLSCILQGNRVYFEAFVQEGNNDFEMTFANMSGPPACAYSFSETEMENANLSVPWASEKSVAISQARLDQLLASDYNHVRESLGITRNFKVETETGSLGPSPPQYTNTYVKENRYLIQETGQPITIRIMVW